MTQAIFFDFWGTLWEPSPTQDLKSLIVKEVQELKGSIDFPLHLQGAIRKGLHESLELLFSKYPLFIVSHSSFDFLDKVCRDWRIKEYFTGLVSSESYGMSKEEAIYFIQEEYGVKMALYVGDTAQDFKTASSFSRPYIHIGSSVFEGALSTFEDFSGLGQTILDYLEKASG